MKYLALIDEEEKQDQASWQMGLFQSVQQILLEPQHPLLMEYTPYITSAPGAWRGTCEMLSKLPLIGFYYIVGQGDLVNVCKAPNQLTLS